MASSLCIRWCIGSRALNWRNAMIGVLERVAGDKEWYICRLTWDGKQATGWGSTRMAALQDAMKDYVLMTKMIIIKL